MTYQFHFMTDEIHFMTEPTRWFDHFYGNLSLAE